MKIQTSCGEQLELDDEMTCGEVAALLVQDFDGIMTAVALNKGELREVRDHINMLLGEKK